MAEDSNRRALCKLFRKTPQEVNRFFRLGVLAQNGNLSQWITEYVQHLESELTKWTSSSPIDLLGKLTQEDFARIVGISQPAIAQLIRKGILTRGAKPLQWLSEYAANLRKQAAGWQSSSGLPDLMTARAALALEQKRHYEIQNAKRISELIPIDTIVKTYEELTTAVRYKLLTLEKRFKSQFPEATPKESEWLSKLINELLTDLSNVRFSPDIRKSIEQGISNIHSSTQDDGQRVGGQVSNPKSRV